MTTKTKLLVLPLEWWMERYPLRNENHLVEIPPVFNRDGWYLNKANNFCWFEHNGKAYQYKQDAFEFNLEYFNHVPLTERQLLAYKELLNLGLKKPMRSEIKKLLEAEDFFRMMRMNRWGARKQYEKVLAKINKLKLKPMANTGSI